MNKEVNYEEWFEQLDNYEKNKKGMSIKTRISFVDEKVTANISQIDKQYEQYKGKFEKLILCIAEGAIQTVYNEASPKYALEDERQEEYEKNIKFANEHMSEYLNILFNEGFDKFFLIISTQFQLKKLAYNLDHIYYNNGWMMTDGKIWKKGFWIKDNKVYSDDSVEILNSKMGYWRKKCAEL